MRRDQQRLNDILEALDLERATDHAPDLRVQIAEILPAEFTVQPVIAISRLTLIWLRETILSGAATCRQ